MEEQNFPGEQQAMLEEEPIPEQYLIKHPLQNTWTLWFYENDRTKDWEQNQREVVSFNTIEDFWSLYNHLKMASELRVGCDYSLFKKGIRPMWEDAANKQGGRWLLSLDRRQRATDLDQYWIEVILFMIGEEYDAQSEQICGAVVNIRAKGDKIGLWTADANKKSAVVDIGVKLKERLGLPNSVLLEFQAHRDTSSKSGPSAKFTV